MVAARQDPMSNPPTTVHAALDRRVTPLPVGLLVTFLNSIATGVVGNSIYVLTKHGYGFDRTTNYILGLGLGLIYIVGAAGAGPGLRFLRRRFPSLGSRGFLAGLMLAMFALCAWPWAAWQVARLTRGPDAVAPVWTIWLCAIAYNALNGVLWPVIESYISGGRSGQVLRRALGLWNISWSGALVIAVLGIAPLIEEHAILAMLLLGLVHLVSLIFLPRFAAEPMPHLVEHHEAHPPVYERLLVTFRILLPTSYLVLSALGPFLPDAAERLGMGAALQAAIAGAWLLPRCLGFLTFDRWHGWHGRWTMPAAGGLLLMTGFGMTVLAPRLASGSLGLALFVTGLVIFGTGMSAIYTGAIYYAMAVGKAEVDAGGTHESLIGVGYTIGPAIGLAASWGVNRGVLGEGAFEPAVVGVVGLLGLVMTAVVLRRIAVISR